FLKYKLVLVKKNFKMSRLVFTIGVLAILCFTQTEAQEPNTCENYVFDSYTYQECLDLGGQCVAFGEFCPDPVGDYDLGDCCTDASGNPIAEGSTTQGCCVPQ
ncbi:unnamed protein product, partial [Owenia fusiformis]